MHGVKISTKQESGQQLRSDEFAIVGVESTIPFHKQVLADQEFAAGNFDTDFIDQREIIPKMRASITEELAKPENFAIAAILLSSNQFGQQSRGTPGETQKYSRRTTLPSSRGRFVDAL